MFPVCPMYFLHTDHPPLSPSKAQLSSIFPDESPTAFQEADSASFLGFPPMPSQRETDSLETDTQSGESKASLFAGAGSSGDDIMSQ